MKNLPVASIPRQQLKLWTRPVVVRSRMQPCHNALRQGRLPAAKFPRQQDQNRCFQPLREFLAPGDCLLRRMSGSLLSHALAAPATIFVARTEPHPPPQSPKFRKHPNFAPATLPRLRADTLPVLSRAANPPSRIARSTPSP